LADGWRQWGGCSQSYCAEPAATVEHVGAGPEVKEMIEKQTINGSKKNHFDWTRNNHIISKRSISEFD
jgi:hypothetical protein